MCPGSHHSTRLNACPHGEARRKWQRVAIAGNAHAEMSAPVMSIGTTALPVVHQLQTAQAHHHAHKPGLFRTKRECPPIRSPAGVAATEQTSATPGNNAHVTTECQPEITRSLRSRKEKLVCARLCPVARCNVTYHRIIHRRRHGVGQQARCQLEAAARVTGAARSSTAIRPMPEVGHALGSPTAGRNARLVA